ncbi:MAG: glycosyltransferase [Halobacteriales archaeon]|nr:glycosyltransferase [Halobacteriales archaeon]
MSGSLGVVVPAYRPDVEALISYVGDLDAELAPTTIRIELDAPRPAIVERLEAAALPAVIHVADRRRGKGAAITDGFERLETEIRAFVDADGSTTAESMADVVGAVREGGADLGVGSRRHPDAIVRSHQTYARRWLGNGFAWLARQLLDAKLFDYQCGAKAIRTPAWRAVRSHLYEPGFAWDVELIAMTAALGYTVTEVPIVWEDHPGSTVSAIDTPLALARGLLAARHRAKLLSDDPLHKAIDAYRADEPALVDRPGWNDD